LLPEVGNVIVDVCEWLSTRENSLYKVLFPKLQCLDQEFPTCCIRTTSGTRRFSIFSQKPGFTVF